MNIPHIKSSYYPALCLILNVALNSHSNKSPWNHKQELYVAIMGTGCGICDISFMYLKPPTLKSIHLWLR